MEKPEYREEREIVTVTANTADAFSNFRKIQSALCIFGGLGFIFEFRDDYQLLKRWAISETVWSFRKKCQEKTAAGPGFAGRKMEASGFGLKEKRRERHCPKNRRIMIWMSAA